MTPEQFKECVKEFRQFGYDPYNTESLNEWWHYQNARGEGP